MNAVSNQSTLSVLIPNINKERIFMMCIRLTWSRDIFGGNQLAWSFWKCSRSPFEGVGLLLILNSSTNKCYICIKSNSFKIFQYTWHVLLVIVVHLHVNRAFGVLIFNDLTMLYFKCIKRFPNYSHQWCRHNIEKNANISHCIIHV